MINDNTSATSLCGLLSSQGSTNCDFNITIGPQEPHIRTWLFQAARDAFERAGIAGGQVLFGNELNEVTSISQKKAFSEPPTFAEQFAAEYFEVLERYTETVEKLAKHQSAVGAMDSQWTDATTQQLTMWNAEENSRLAGIKSLLNDNPSDPTGKNKARSLQLPSCSRKIKGNGIQRAVDFVRAGRAPELFDELQSSLQIAQATVKWLLWDRDGAFPEDLETATTEYLAMLQIGLPEVEQAIDILREEKASFFRVYAKEEPAIGDRRLVSLMPPTSNLPTAFWQGKLQGLDEVETLDGTILNTDWYKTTSVVHPHRSAQEFIQYMRDGALRALNAGNFIGDSEVRNLYGKILSMGTRQVGDQKLLISKNASNIYIQLMGRFPDWKPENRFLIIRDQRGYLSEKNEGLACLLEGNIGGVVCDIDDFVVASTNTIGVGDDISGSPFEFSVQTSFNRPPLSIQGPIYHVALERKKTRQLLFTFDYSVLSATPVAFPIGGTLLDDVSELVDRDPEQCGDPTTHCTGLPTNLVPPLENELTSDSDLYETSWRHYLNLATAAANEADQLGQQLVEEGLQMDMKAEEAARALEEICGGVVNVGDVTGDGTDLLEYFSSSDASLANCLPSKDDTIPMVSIGPKLCLWKFKDENFDWCECPSGVSGCPPCPLVKFANETCEDVISRLELDDTDFELKDIDDSLNLIDTIEKREEKISSGNDLAIIREMRVRAAGNGGKITQNDWDNLTKMSGSWFNKKFFLNLVSTVHLNADPFYHYTLYVNNNPRWSTYKAKNGFNELDQSFSNCPSQIPWHLYDSIDNPQINCEYCNYQENQQRSYNVCLSGTYTNWNEAEFLSGAVQARIIWGSRLNDILKTASLLAGLPGGFTYPKSGSRGSSKGHPMNSLPNIGFPYYSIDLGSSENAVYDEDGRVCIGLGENDYYIPSVESLPADYGQNIISYLYPDSNDLYLSRFAIGSSLNRCSRSESIHFDDYVRHDGAQFENDLYTSTLTLWNNNHIYGVRGRLMNNRIPGFMMGNSDIRDAKCSSIVVGGNTGAGSENGSLGKFRMHATQNVGELVDMCIDNDRLWDALEFAAYIAEEIEPACDDVKDLAEEKSFLNSEDDLYKVSAYIRCAADELREKIQRTVFYNMPKKVIDARKNSGSGQYSGLQGEILNVHLEIDSALVELSSAVNSIPDILYSMNQQIKATTLAIKATSITGKISKLQTKIAMWETTIKLIDSLKTGIEGAIGFYKKPGVETIVNAFLGFGYTAIYSRVLQLQHDISSLQSQATENEIDIHLNSLATELGKNLSQLRTTLDTLKIKANQVNQALERLRGLRNKAEVLAARATLAGSDAAGRVYPTNTVMRRRYNTTRIRYENALERAKKLAFIARRAIEFRLGEDLTEMTQDMTLVDAPSAWVEDLCTVTGMDYSAIREESDPMTDYSGQFIGDYVKKLSDVVESYSFDFPFHDSEDVAVISLRDDIKTSVGTCLMESHNYLVFSGDLGYGEELDDESVFGWKRSLSECAPTTDTVMHPDEVCTWVRKDPTTYLKGTDNQTIDASSVIEGDWVPTEILNATMVMDATGFFVENAEGVMVAQARTSGSKYMGFVQQTTQVLSSGDWMLSLWYKPLIESIPGKVEIYNANWQLMTTVPLSGDEGPWRKAYVPFNLSAAGVVHVQIHASAEDAEVPNTGAGAVEVWGIQLESLTPEMCLPNGCITREYQATDARRLVHVAGCIDTTGSSFRQQFRRGCSCLNSNPCTNQSPDIQCYYETDFVLNLADIESGKYLTSDAIAVGNYNYRHGSIAANIVGSQILSCPEGGSYQCQANGYLPYTLYHDGEVSIRNHGGWTEDFSMNQARIEHGKALAAEVVVTNPLSSQHQSLLSGFDKKEFRGRPLQGQYTLRIWETPGLQWQNLEDIQLIWRYTYWTAF